MVQASPAERAKAMLDAPPGDFDPKAFINLALSGEGDESADMRLSSCMAVLYKLEMEAKDVDKSIQKDAGEFAVVAPQMVRDIASVKEQVSAVRNDMTALVEEVSSVEASSEASVKLLREVLVVKQRMTAAAETLRQAERVSQLMLSAEAAVDRSDFATAADGVAELGGCLDALGGERRHALFPQAEGRLAKLQTKLLEDLVPPLMEAIGARDANATRALVKQFGALGAVERAEACYVQCRQGPLFEAWNRGSHEAGGAAGDALRTFWRGVHEGSAAEKAWACTVFPAAGAALVASVYAEALGALKPPMEAGVAAILPTSDAGDAEAEARLCLLEEAWKDALAAATALGDALAGGGGTAAAAAQHALLQPFEAQQRALGDTMLPRLYPRLPAVRALAELLAEGESLPMALGAAAASVERAGGELLDAGGLLQAAIQRALGLGGALCADGLLQMLPRLFDRFAQPLLALLAEALAAAARVGEAEAEAAARGCLALLRAAHALRDGVGKLHGALRLALRREARAHLPADGAADAAGTRTPAQQAAAQALLQTLDAEGGVAPLGPRVAEVLLEAQRLALRALMLPISRGLAAIHSKALRDAWRGATAGAQHLSPEQDEEEEEVQRALLAFTPSPQDYMMQIGEALHSLPLLLEPHAATGTLTLLHASLRPPAGPGALEDGAIGWLHAVAHASVGSLLEAVGRIAAFSPGGAKQLAADVSYLSDIFSGPRPRAAHVVRGRRAASTGACPHLSLPASLACQRGVCVEHAQWPMAPAESTCHICAHTCHPGLSLPPFEQLAQLKHLLTCKPAELPEAARTSHALPPDFPAAIAEKRGGPRAAI